MKKNADSLVDCIVERVIYTDMILKGFKKIRSKYMVNKKYRNNIYQKNLKIQNFDLNWKKIMSAYRQN